MCENHFSEEMFDKSREMEIRVTRGKTFVFITIFVFPNHGLIIEMEFKMFLTSFPKCPLKTQVLILSPFFVIHPSGNL